MARLGYVTHIPVGLVPKKNNIAGAVLTQVAADVSQDSLPVRVLKFA